MEKKKPDQVVYNEEKQRYDAFLKPYATDLGAPVIEKVNLAPWKNKGIGMVNAAMAAEYDEIKKQYQALQERFEYNELVYAAKFSFQPLVGHTYHLYKNTKAEAFLSILAPHECTFEHLGSFRLGSDYVWEKIETA
ncbi:DUF2452 domain-containing protein [Flagellimonas sp. DF-77]|uniref:DUF2452 domain-containing protein n=1 Tax=Flagellimonas algarum TaxID=3230298 RepID=UPI003395FD55